MVFPGQGSQSLGMLADLAATYPVVLETFGEASAVLGLDLWQLVQAGPEAELNRTEHTQPAMLAAGVAVWRLWCAQGLPAPALLAGHSLGEYSALVAAESLAFADAVALVAERGRLMQAAVPEGAGAMAAILGLEDDQVRAVCAEAAQGDVVEAVNFNAPGQVVVAGWCEAVERAMVLAKAAGAKRALPLPVSVPSHCALMQPAAEALLERLGGLNLRAPRIPVLHNVTAAPCADPARLPELLSQQVRRPVRWVETVQALAAAQAGPVLEAGPGKVLTGLVKRIDKHLTALAVYDARTFAAAAEAVKHAD